MMKSKKMNKSYSAMKQLTSFDDRFKYLSLRGQVGSDTFGYDRHLNQKLYKSREWKNIRDKIIIRDGACDLGVKGREITGNIYIHHINPIDINDIKEASKNLLNLDNLICTSFDTHNAIHYGDESFLKKNKIANRKPNDTIPWAKK